MPDYTPEHLKKLDQGIKSMIANGASQSDVESYAKDFNNQFGLKKKVDTQSTSTEQLPSSVPSVSEGGTSGLEIGGLEPQSQPNNPYGIQNTTDNNFNPIGKSVGKITIDNTKNIDLESARTYKKPVKTSLESDAFEYKAPNKDITLDEERNNKKLEESLKTKLLMDSYDSYKENRTKEQAIQGRVPFAQDDSQNTIDFYFDHLKRTDPEQYSYMINRQKSLSEDKQAHLVDGSTEDVQEDDLMIQKTHADIMRDALALKANIFAGKKELATNVLKNNYSEVMKSVEDETRNRDFLQFEMDQIKNTLESYKIDENGQIMSTPYNAKEIEQLVNQYKDYGEQLQKTEESLQEKTADPDFRNAITLLDETEKNYNSLERVYSKIREKDPNVFKGLPEYKKQLEEEQRAQFSKYLQDEVSGGDLGIMERVGQSQIGTGLLKTAAFLPKTVFGGSKGTYKGADWLADVVESNVNDFDAISNPLPTGFDEPVYQDGKWNLKYLPAKAIGTLADMVPTIALTAATEGATAGLLARMGASGEAGTAIGSFVGQYATTVQGNYEEFKNAGMTERQAMDNAKDVSLIQSVIGSLSPDINLSRAVNQTLEQYIKSATTKGAGKEFAKNLSRKFWENAQKEIPQELLETYSEIVHKNDIYRDLGISEQITKDATPAMIETFIITTLTSLVMAGGSAKPKNDFQKQALLMASEQPSVILERAKKMLDNKQLDKDGYDKINDIVTKHAAVRQKVDNAVSAEKKAEIVPIIAEKEELKEQKKVIDESQHEMINEKIKNKDEEIKNVLSEPSKEQKEHDDFTNSFVLDLEQEANPIIESDEKTDSEISQPIELSPVVEDNRTEQEKQIEALEAARTDLKENQFLQYKIDFPEYTEKDNALEAEINKLKGKEEGVSESITEISQKEVNEQTNQEKETVKELPKAARPKEQVKDTGLIDEEAEDDSKIEDDKSIVDKANQDIKQLKGYMPFAEGLSKEASDVMLKNATEKFMGILERAYKAKIEKKISQVTYEEIRDRAEQVAGKKLSKNKLEIDAKVNVYKQKVKERLLGKGFKNVALSSFGPGITPKTVEGMIDLTAELIKSAAHLNRSIRELTDKALEKVKQHPYYKSALENEGITDKDFGKAFENYMSKIEVDSNQTSEASNPENTQEGTLQSNKETEDGKGKEQENDNDGTSRSNKKDEPEDSGAAKKNDNVFQENVKKERMLAIRLKANKKYESVIKSIADDLTYNPQKRFKEIKDFINETLDQYENADSLISFAQEFLNENPFDPNIANVAASNLANRIDLIAQKEDNPFLSEQYQDIANQVRASDASAVTKASQKLGNQRMISEDLPLTESQLKGAINKQIEQEQDASISKKTKEALKQDDLFDSQEFDNALNKALKDKITEYAQTASSKEKVASFDAFMDDLVVPLEDC